MLYATSSYGGFLRPEDTILEPVFITGGCRKDEDFSHQTRRFSREAPQNGAFSAKPAAGGHTDGAAAESHMTGKRSPRRRAAVVNTGSKNPEDSRLAAPREGGGPPRLLMKSPSPGEGRPDRAGQ